MAIRIPVGTYQTISRGVVARDLNCPKWFSFATGAPVVRVDNLELRGLSTRPAMRAEYRTVTPCP